MGIEIVRLTDSQPETESITNPQDLVQLTCRDYTVANPEMYIWLMVAMKDRVLFPWWQYNHTFDQELQTLNELWSVSTPQNLFDCLFLSMLKRFAGSQFFAILPGNIKSEGWGKLKESDRTTFLRGQGCVYHLQGAFDSKLAINWVPFWQPQSLVRDPSFSNFWRLFVASRGEDSTSSISFFSLSDPSKLAKVVSLLIEPEEERSEKLSQLVDWFGLYTTPVMDNFSPACVLYASQKEYLARFGEMQKSFTGLFEETKKQLIASPRPSTALRILSRHIPL